MKLLYVVGSSRCGSTILGNVLGEVPGILSAGEVRFLWERHLQGRRCGCGSVLASCAVWGEVLDRTGRRDAAAAAEMLGWQREVLRFKQLPWLLLASRSGSRRWTALDRYLGILGATYEAAAEVSGASVIVDTSKRPADAAALRHLGDLQAKLLHVVRDPRAVAYSRSVWKANPDGVRTGGMGGISIRKSLVHWTTTNVAAELIRGRYGPERSELLLYERFANDPRAGLRDVLNLIGSSADAPFRDAHTIELGVHHTVSGNPDRFMSGPMTISPDERWRASMPPRDRRTVEIATAPLRWRYGYARAAGTRERRGP